MKIAIDVSGYEMGNFGIGVYIRNLIATMTQMAPDHQYILTSFPGRHWKRRADTVFPSDKYRYFRIPYIPRRGLNVLWHDWKLFPVDKLMGGVDIYHGTNFEAPYVAKAKKVITVFDTSWIFFPAEMQKSANYYNRWLPANLAEADAIIVISETTRKDLLDCYKVDAEKMHVIYLAPNPEVCSPNSISLDTIKHHYGFNSPYLLAVGNLEPRKNIATLLQGYAQVSRKYPDIDLVLVGNRDRDFPRLYSLVENLGLQNKVIFTGYVPDDDLAALYRGALTFVYPSLYEGFGLPVLEAMSCGVPLIASTTPALVEVAAEAAWYFSPLDVESLAKGIESFIDNEALRREFSERGLRRSKLFTWGETAKRTLSVYESLC